MPVSNHFVFTLNNPEHDYLPGLENNARVRYAIWQREVGAQGTPHLQGYLECFRRTTLRQLQEFIPLAHFERRRRTRDQARAYARKEETRAAGPWELGTWIPDSSGEYDSLEGLKHRMDTGATTRDLLTDCFATMAKHYRFAEYYRRNMGERRRSKSVVRLFVGPTDVGKSYRVRQLSPDAYWLSGTKWFDDYDGHSDVVLDEFKGHLPLQLLLRILDENPLNVENKGGHVNFNPKNIFITSNYIPSDWYSTEVLGRQRDALIRRIDYFYYVSSRSTMYGTSNYDEFYRYYV